MIKLKTDKIYWNPDDNRIHDILNAGKVDIDQMSKEDIEYLITELDRRLLQLWDKIGFERMNKLTHYSKLEKSTP